jgi:hypothetical protein
MSRGEAFDPESGVRTAGGVPLDVGSLTPQSDTHSHDYFFSSLLEAAPR